MPIPYLSQQPVDDFGLTVSDIKYSATLGSATDTTLTVPGSAPRYKAVIRVEPDAVVWFAVGATAAVPTGATFATVSSEMISGDTPLCREVKAGDVLHFISVSSNRDVSVVFYALNTNN